VMNRQTPTHKVVVPGRDFMNLLVSELLTARQTFTVQPSETQQTVWHLGLLPEGVALVTETMKGAWVHPEGESDT
jgi:hypothetical protein